MCLGRQREADWTSLIVASGIGNLRIATPVTTDRRPRAFHDRSRRLQTTSPWNGQGFSPPRGTLT
jgi:hypothetical protein